RRAARPVHLVVDPRDEPEPLGLLGPEPDALEVRVAGVLHLEPVPAVEDDALHPLVTQLPELEPHLVGVELAVQEPEREDPVVARRLGERVARERPALAHGITVAFTKPSGLSIAVWNAMSISSSLNGSVTMPPSETRPAFCSATPVRRPCRIVAGSRK